MNGVGESLPPASVSLANLAAAADPFRPSASLANRVRAAVSRSTVARPTTASSRASAPRARSPTTPPAPPLVGAPSPSSRQKNPPTSSPATREALRTGVDTRRNNFDTTLDGVDGAVVPRGASSSRIFKDAFRAPSARSPRVRVSSRADDATTRAARGARRVGRPRPRARACSASIPRPSERGVRREIAKQIGEMTPRRPDGLEFLLQARIN